MSINQLKFEIAQIKSELDRVVNPIKTSYADKAYNYLAIGNSITKHNICDYWWNDVGMAASSQECDYVHRIVNYLEKQHGSVASEIYNFYIWEVQAADRSETLGLIDVFLDSRLDLVTVQLGENVVNLESFENDLCELIRYITAKAPKAKIVLIDDFWENDKRYRMKKLAAESQNILFADLKAVRNKKEYQAGMGSQVMDKNGKVHVINHKGVAIHPGDFGMKYIADKVIELIND